MIYKWVTLGNKDKYFTKWVLKSIGEIEEWKNFPETKLSHTFSTIQHFDENGKYPECPIIYADFDGEQALGDTRILYARIKSSFGIEPLVFFSGKKGFHLILPYYVNHEKCSEIARLITMKIGGFNTLDKGRYGSRIMFRENNTVHPDTLLYKRVLTKEELFSLSLSDIMKLALDKGPDVNLFGFSFSGAAIDKFNVLIKEAKDILEEKKCKNEETYYIGGTLSPCIMSLLESPIPEGEKHYTIFILSRYLRSRGYSEHEAINMIAKNETLNKYIGHIEEVVFSTYTASKSVFGCYEDNIYSLILRRHCSKLCEHNKEELI